MSTQIDTAAAELRAAAAQLAAVEARGATTPADELVLWMDAHSAAFDARHAAEQKLIAAALAETDEREASIAAFADSMDDDKSEPAAPAQLRSFAPLTGFAGGPVHATTFLVDGRASLAARPVCDRSYRREGNYTEQPAGTPLSCSKCIAIVGASASFVGASL